jgi:hypothetical protein
LRLATHGRWIVEAATGKPLLLRGVNLSGMEYTQEPLAGVTADEVREIVAGWNCDIVRLPFVQSRVSDVFYVDELRQIVDWIWNLGAFTILDLQWLSPATRVAPEPDLGSISCWDNLARAFADCPHVIFDLLNEPHDVPLERWREWATVLAGTVRAVDPKRLLMVSGMDWGYDLRGVPLDLPHIIYSTHVYPSKGTQWDDCFGSLAETLPVFAGEFGGGDEDLVWGARLLDYMDQRQMGWTAWSWRDRPHLQQGGEPTRFGRLVKARLAPAG